MFKLSERKWDACFSPKENPLVCGNVEWWSELDIVNIGNFEDQACCDRFIAGLVDETLQGKLNTNGHRDKDGKILWLK